MKEWRGKIKISNRLNIISNEEIQKVVDKLNKRSRKILDYRAPFELYHSEVLHLT